MTRPNSGLPVLLSSVLAILAASQCPAADYVWWEGESPAESNFPGKSWFDASTLDKSRLLLSGGDWLSASGKRGSEELFARYRVSVPADAEYSLWSRKFWKHGPFRWRFDGDQWRECGKDIGLADSTDLREHVCANWVHLGKVPLKKGPHVFELRLLAGEGESVTACFDCFLLTPGPFMPRGKLKPDERSGLADDGCFAYEPTIDAFGAEALLDLRHLNEKVAGERGFVRRDGAHLVLGGGERVKFWAVNVGPNNIRQSRQSIDYMARRLAKLGVNMVRYHGPLFDGSGDPAAIDREALDGLHYLVAALKRQGIYTKVSFYFPLWFEVKPHYGIGGFEGLENKRPFALLYFDPRMQEIHRSWARAILTTTNPYTDVPLARDPAVAIVEIVNEDSYFFHTFSRKNIPPEHWRRLERLFGQWLTERYGSLEKAVAAWGKARTADDEPSQGRAGLLDAWHMTRKGLQQGPPDKVRRIGDQVRFLAEHQRDYYASTVRCLKEDLKAGSLVSASNWKTADAEMLDALERYTYTAGDVIDRHGYFGGPHKGDGANYSVRAGHTFSSLAAVTVPERLPLQVFQVEGFPHIISEIGWTNPNRYRADATFLASAYASLQGIDGLFFFAAGSNLLCDTTMNKFALSCPVIAGTFPAAALQYRRGDVAEAPVVVRQALVLEDLYAMKGSSAPEAAALDELRTRDVPQDAETTKGPTAIDPLAFYVGRVERCFAAASRTTIDPRTNKLIDRDRKIAASVTGELAWDYGRGLVTVSTPRSQGAAGFLAAAGRIDLADVIIESRNEYAGVWAVSLDGKPLAESARILIQIMTEEQPYGFRSDAGRITAMGGWPFGVRRIDATITLRLKGGGNTKVVALDENGYATDKAVKTRGGDDGSPLVIEPAPDAIYHLVTR